MTSPTKQLIAQITELEDTLKQEQQVLRRHQAYFNQLFHQPSVILLMTLLPAFMTGWSVARMKRRRHQIKRLLKFGLLNISSFYK
jgi:lipopolysaccharide export LptBFGC system permease protein LptF